MHIVVEIIGYVSFILRALIICIVDLYIMYFRVGLVWRRRRSRPTSMERRDLVMQLAPQSPTHSRLSSSDMILVLNESFLDRALWKGLCASGAQPSAVVTGVSYGGIGFYTALNLILCGFNVHGVTRSQKSVNQAERMMQIAVERQSRLHKEWMGKTGRLIPHQCDMSDTAAVSNLCTILSRDPDLRVVVGTAGTAAAPPRLSPQRLEQHVATHHVGHSLLMLRLLQYRLQQRNIPSSLWPHWRFVVVVSPHAGTSNLKVESIFDSHDDEEVFRSTFDRYSGYSHAEMCKLLFAFSLSRFLERENRLASLCTVNVVDPGPARSHVIANSQLPLSSILDSNIAAIFRLSPVISALYVTDLCLSKRVDDVNGHYFRMGEDQTAVFAALQKDMEARAGIWVNSPLFRGTPGPVVSLSTRMQDAVWRFTLSYFTSHALLEAKAFYR
ncbi:retinol dehydrogenase 14 [Trypanosoma grayi]|uniref:retinol dehydrogenase 14 n=1 Tax=Trypanosoma grayi TaxID=71804 RepID=UPI0004F3FD01|nr:retinol dehydrogenase 14 [Trypanosoma grayi]KEG13949.1 retinol dehydrogenase 14 [Trypanosoma grayi]